ncbi:helix-turn-helix domain-containing protein [Candidatus Falkowbacteria bacterium]|nr:helix-turn-helix domain-containing protein [Candidatus Falkowbacteria bacterium]
MSQNKEKTPEPALLWLSVSEAAKFGGVTGKTIRRAIQAKAFRFRVIKNRYQIEAGSLIEYLNSAIKLRHKFRQNGVAQYVKEWVE